MWQQLGEVLIGGVSIGAIYAVLAIGFSLLYGVTGIFNYAYGSFFTWGAYFAWVLFAAFGWMNYPIAFILVALMLFPVGLIVDRALIRTVRWRPDWFVSTVFITLALALFLDNLALCVFGPRPKGLPAILTGKVEFGGFTASSNDIAVLLISIAIVVALALFLSRTRAGMAMRAIGQDMVGAKIVGIAVNRVFAYTFAISVIMAGLAAMLLSRRYFIYPAGGWDAFIKAFIIAVVGGIGNMVGTVCAAFILGIAEVIIAWQFGFSWVMVSWFLILVILLVVKPTGLFGGKA